MWKTLLKWLLKFTLSQLGDNVAEMDAETQKQIDEYNRRRAEVEKARDAAEIELGRIENDRLTLLAKRIKQSNEIEFLQTQVDFLENKLRNLKDEKDKKLNDIGNLSDDDLLHGDLPGAS